MFRRNCLFFFWRRASHFRLHRGVSSMKFTWPWRQRLMRDECRAECLAVKHVMRRSGMICTASTSWRTPANSGKGHLECSKDLKSASEFSTKTVKRVMKTVTRCQEEDFQTMQARMPQCRAWRLTTENSAVASIGLGQFGYGNHVWF